LEDQLYEKEDRMEIDEFLNLIRRQTIIKVKLYDGIGSLEASGLDPVSRFMFSITEEAGEVSSALTRKRYELAKAECVDVAHSALLLYKAIEGLQNNELRNESP